MCTAQITAAAKVVKSPRLNPDNPDFKVSNTRPIATIKIDRICFLLNFSQPNKNNITGTIITAEQVMKALWLALVKLIPIVERYR